MSDPVRPSADTGRGSGGPFPSRYGRVGQTAESEQEETASPQPRPKRPGILAKTAADQADAGAEPKARLKRPSILTRASSDDGSSATADEDKPARPGILARAAEQRERRRQRSENSGPVPAVAGAPSVPVSRATATDRPTASTRPVTSPGRTSGLRTDTGTLPVTEPARRAAPTQTPGGGRRLPDQVAREVGREYAPEAEVIVGRPHPWQLRRKVTVVRGRSSRRLIRRLDTWSVFKVSFIVYLLAFLIILIAGLITWRVAIQVGFVTDIQKAVRSLFDDRKFILHGNVVFKYAVIGGAVMTVVLTILNVVAAMLYNLISDIFGGVQVIVVSEPD